MAVLKRQIHHHEKGNHDETWYYLARNTETSEVFIVHEWAGPGAGAGEKPMSVAEFLSGSASSAQANLLSLIGTLVPDE